MEKLKIISDGTLSGVRKTKDGYLAASVLCARTGIQDYAGFELNRPELERIRVYRPESSVFSTDSLRTYAGKPATNDHPENPVTSDNWKELAVGAIGEDIMRDGEYVRVPLLLMDKACIDDVENGKCELSMGYEMALDFTEGTTPNGEDYDAVMMDLKMNHIAVVDKGRAGSKARIGDSWGVSPLTNTETNMTMKTKAVLVDGLTVETTDSGAQAIEKLQAEKQVLSDAVTSAQDKHDATLAAKDKELAAKDAEIKTLKDSALDGAALDKLVADRSKLMTKAQAIAKDTDFTGMSDLDVKTAAVQAIYGEEFTQDKSSAYIEAAFDLAEIKAPVKDSVRESLKDRKPVEQVADNGQSAYEQRLNEAWKGK